MDTKDLIIVGGGHAIPPRLIEQLRIQALLCVDEGHLVKKALEFRKVHVPDMTEIVEMVKRSKTNRHKELMRQGRNEFRRKGRKV